MSAFSELKKAMSDFKLKKPTFKSNFIIIIDFFIFQEVRTQEHVLPKSKNNQTRTMQNFIQNPYPPPKPKIIKPKPT